LITPALSGTILDGITRDSILTLARKNGITVEERKISVAEVQQLFEAGKRIEAFGTGTAALIAPIAEIDVKGQKLNPYTGDDALMYKLKKHLNEVWRGIKPDEWGWNHII
jgi:branched-chain amino acid aminotransferase